MKDFNVKVSEKDCIVIVRFPMMGSAPTFVTWDGLQHMMPETPDGRIFVGKPNSPAQGRTVFAYCQQHIPGVKEVGKYEDLNEFERSHYDRIKSEALKSREAHIRKLWNRVSISEVLDYIDRVGGHSDYYPGVAEMGYDDKPMICANWNPPKMKRLGDWIEKFYQGNIEVDWYDEWTSCSDCGKAVRTSPDSYGWQQSWVWVLDCEILCHECAEKAVEDVIEHYQNKMTHALPYWMQDMVKEAGFKCLEDDEYCVHFETGFHPGQNDTPEKALKMAKELLPFKFDYLYLITGCGQFDIDWTILVRKQEVEEEV